MNIKLYKNKTIEMQGIITFIFEDNAGSCEIIDELRKNNTFEAKEGECFYYTREDNGLKYEILIGLGSNPKQLV